MVEFPSLDSLLKNKNYPSVLNGKTVLLYCDKNKKESVSLLVDNFAELKLKKIIVLFNSNPYYIKKYVYEKGNVVKNHNLFKVNNSLQNKYFVEEADIAIGM